MARNGSIWLRLAFPVVDRQKKPFWTPWEPSRALGGARGPGGGLGPGALGPPYFPLFAPVLRCGAAPPVQCQGLCKLLLGLPKRPEDPEVLSCVC